MQALNTMQYNVIQYNSAVSCSTVQLSAVQCNVMQCLQYKTKQCNTVQYSTMKCNKMHLNKTLSPLCCCLGEKETISLMIGVVQAHSRKSSSRALTFLQMFYRPKGIAFVCTQPSEMSIFTDVFSPGLYTSGAM